MTIPSIRELIVSIGIGLVSAAGNSLAETSDGSREVLNSAPLPRNQILANSHAIAFRAFPTESFVALDNTGGTWAIRPELIYGVGANDIYVNGFAKSKGVSVAMLTPYELVDGLKISARRNLKHSFYNANTASMKRLNIGLNDDPARTIDASIVYSAIDSGLIEPVDVQKFGVVPEFTAYDKVFSVDPSFAEKFNLTYSNMSKIQAIESSSPAKAAFSYGKLANDAKGDDFIKNISTVNVIDVSYGKPLPYAATEKHLNIPKSIKSKWDIYWVNLAFSIKNRDNINITEARYYMTLPKDSIAIELIPERYVTEKKVSQKLNSPEIGIEANGISVKLGEFFERTVEYEQLKPTVISDGLQENAFGWILRDDMTDEGAKRFIAIVGLPKGTKRLRGQCVVTFKLNKLLGFQNDSASASTQAIDEALQN